MDCKQLEKKIKEVMDTPESDNDGIRQVVEHLRNCSTCREKYQSVLNGSRGDHVIPDPANIRAVPVSQKEAPELLHPIEFKDKPIRFTLFIDGREEPIKVVEPEFDTPIPEESRLVVDDRGVCIADVRFGFKPNRQRPYTLLFRTRNRSRHRPPKALSFGPPDKNMQKVFTETIVDEGGVRADLEMAHGKARLHIRYAGG